MKGRTIPREDEGERKERTVRLRSGSRRAGWGLLVAALAALEGVARAAEPCAVRLEPADAEPAWRAAVAALRARPSADIDCREVTIKVARAGAVLIFTTHDNRRAVREVATPAELAPTLEALSITLAAPATSSASAAPPGPGGATAPVAATPSAAPVAAAPEALSMRTYPEDEPPPVATREAVAAPEGADAARANRLALGLHGGARMAASRPLVSPVLAASFGVTRAGWEAAALAQWEPGYEDLGS